ncbi:MAG: formyltetrahydrofolate deformylase [Planctomycetota bacterium]|jgi:formyltetrahydrofolate deformylase
MTHSPPTGILLLSCPDQKGLVSTVADFVFRHGGNIVHADQHTDREEGIFLQRVEFELDSLTIGRDEIGAAFAPLAERLGMRWTVRYSDDVRRMAILVSRYGHCAYDLLARHRLGELPAELPIVISNHEDLASIGCEFPVEFHHLPVTPETRARQEQAILDLLRGHDVDLVVLARYMQILSPDLVRRHENRIINIHHSFLPAFAGGRPYHKAHERGVKIIGATAHYVTAALDEGPIIEQDVVRVSHRDSVDDLVHKGRDLEKVVLARAVHLHLENRVLVYGNKTVVFD